MNINKKTIVITALAIVVIAGLIIYSQYQSRQIKRGSNLIEQAIESSSADPCADITIQSEFVSQDACYNYIAQTTNNKALCDKIKQQALKDNCYENVE